MTNKKLKERIQNLLSRIEIELISLSYYPNLEEIIESIKNDVADAKKAINSNNNLELKIVCSNLEYILEAKIEKLNTFVRDSKKSENIFLENYDENEKKLNDIQREIEELINFLKEKMGEIGQSIETKYKKEIENLNSELSTIKRYEQEKRKEELNGKAHINLTLYPSTSSLIQSYINKLTFFRSNIEEYQKLKEQEEKIEEAIKDLKNKYSNKSVLDSLNNALNTYKEGVKNILEKLTIFNKNTIQEHINILQEKMIDTLKNIDKIAKTRDKIDDYSKYLSNVSLMNVDYNTILEIERSVLESGLNDELFYKVLYFLIEKEKYSHKHNNKEFELYSKLSEQSKVKLEKMFVEEFSKYSKEEVEQVVKNYKINGYLGSVDIEYEKYFDSIKTETGKYDTKERKIEVKEETKQDSKNISLNSKFEVITYYTDMHLTKEIIVNKETDKILFKAREIFSAVMIDEDRILISAVKHHMLESFVINTDGKIILRSAKMTGQKLLNFLCVTIYENVDLNNEIGYVLFNKNGEVLKTYIKEDNLEIYHNSAYERVIAVTNKSIDFFTKEGKLINSFDLNNNPYNLNEQVIDERKQDGTITLINKNFETKTITIGFLNHDGKLLFNPVTIKCDDSYQLSNIAYQLSNIGFNESLSVMPYKKDGKIYFGYINKEGTFVLKGDYISAGEFINGVARIERINDERQVVEDLIDNAGNSVSKKICDDYICTLNSEKRAHGTIKKIEYDEQKKAYKIISDNFEEELTVYGYKVETILSDSRPIYEIMENLNENVRKKIKSSFSH